VRSGPAPDRNPDDEELDMTLNWRLAPVLTAAALALGVAGTAEATGVAVCTDAGNFTLEVFDDQAPAHAANFLEYVDRGFYNGTVFHRVIEGFVVQGGGYTRTFRNKTTLAPVVNESQNGLGNDRGTLSAARTSDPDSATSQFYVNLENNTSLNTEGDRIGYTVFGRVTDGIAVIDNIAALPTGSNGPFSSDVTDPLIAVTSMTRIVPDGYPNLSAEERHVALRSEIDAAVAAGNNDAAAAHFNEYRAACGGFEPELLLTEANVLSAVGNSPAAFESITEYLRVADNTSEDYFAAMSLARELEAAAAAEPSANDQRLAELAADCEFPTPPSIPNANDATMEAMVETQGLVQTYLEESTEVLECLEEIAEDDDLADEERALASAAYNNEVANQEALAERWNTQREAFLSQQQ
jgi:cyclophilin family peptidyl-prolyl cis-trans isomerase